VNKRTKYSFIWIDEAYTRSWLPMRKKSITYIKKRTLFAGNKTTIVLSRMPGLKNGDAEGRVGNPGEGNWAKPGQGKRRGQG
jgi:hypothetical protein